MKPSRLIIVSNRLPYQFTEKKGQLNITPSSGGLVSSIKSYLLKSNAGNKNPIPALWVGSADIAEKKFNSLVNPGTLSHEGIELNPVFMPGTVKDKHYNGFCNNTIWPLFHYFPSYAKFSDEYFEHYTTANQIFREKLLKLYQPGDLVWIHDYHLMLLPAMLRKHIPDASIGFFLHIPFPSFEVFRILPSNWRVQILKGLLGADLVGFHTQAYVQHFLKSIQQILGYDHVLRTVTAPERSISVDTFPVSIDFDKFYSASGNSEIFGERNKIKKRLYDMQIIISVDRLDYTKGLTNRLAGFELFLEKYPEYRGKVAYVLIVVPSRDIITRYKENKSEIEELVSRINGRYGNIDWTPVVYQYRSVDFKKMCGLYIAADVALITPLRDGMNLVAKEFIASRNDKRGVLILSETAGASAELGEALIVNPTDKEEIAYALHNALTMPVGEQASRNEVMQERLRHYDVVKWAEDFISRLLQWKMKQEYLQVKELGEQTEKAILKKYSASSNRLIFLDYDGTLMPFARMPHLAMPSDNVLDILNLLAEDKRNHIVIISGRDRAVLEKWLGHLPIHLVAEHGAFCKMNGKGWQPTLPVTAEWKSSLFPVFNLFTERCANTFIEEKALSLAWHYRNAEKELSFVRSRELVDELMEMSSYLDFQVVDGNKVIEARARGIDKGTAANTWLQKDKYDFVLAIGDDRTDEDLFRAIGTDGFSIRVGLTQSAAKYNFKEQKDVISFLKKLLATDKQKAESAGNLA